MEHFSTSPMAARSHSVGQIELQASRRAPEKQIGPILDQSDDLQLWTTFTDLLVSADSDSLSCSVRQILDLLRAEINRDNTKNIWRDGLQISEGYIAQQLLLISLAFDLQATVAQRLYSGEITSSNQYSRLVELVEHMDLLLNAPDSTAKKFVHLFRCLTELPHQGREWETRVLDQVGGCVQMIKETRLKFSFTSPTSAFEFPSSIRSAMVNRLVRFIEEMDAAEKQTMTVVQEPQLLLAHDSQEHQGVVSVPTVIEDDEILIEVEASQPSSQAAVDAFDDDQLPSAAVQGVDDAEEGPDADDNDSDKTVGEYRSKKRPRASEEADDLEVENVIRNVPREDIDQILGYLFNATDSEHMDSILSGIFGTGGVKETAAAIAALRDMFQNNIPPEWESCIIPKWKWLRKQLGNPNLDCKRPKLK